MQKISKDGKWSNGLLIHVLCCSVALVAKRPQQKFLYSPNKPRFCLTVTYCMAFNEFVACLSDSSDSGEDETGRSGPQSDVVCATLGTTLLLAVAWVVLQILLLIGCCLTLGRRERRRSDRVRLETDFQPKHVTWGDVNQG